MQYDTQPKRKKYTEHCSISSSSTPPSLPAKFCRVSIDSKEETKYFRENIASLQLSSLSYPVNFAFVRDCDHKRCLARFLFYFWSKGRPRHSQGVRGSKGERKDVRKRGGLPFVAPDSTFNLRVLKVACRPLFSALVFVKLFQRSFISLENLSRGDLITNHCGIWIHKENTSRICWVSSPESPWWETNWT